MEWYTTMYVSINLPSLSSKYVALNHKIKAFSDGRLDKWRTM